MYKGYLDTAVGSELVAVKTGKGTVIMKGTKVLTLGAGR